MWRPTPWEPHRCAHNTSHTPPSQVYLHHGLAPTRHLSSCPKRADIPLRTCGRNCTAFVSRKAVRATMTSIFSPLLPPPSTTESVCACAGGCVGGWVEGRWVQEAHRSFSNGRGLLSVPRHPFPHYRDIPQTVLRICPERLESVNTGDMPSAFASASEKQAVKPPLERPSEHSPLLPAHSPKKAVQASECQETFHTPSNPPSVAKSAAPIAANHQAPTTSSTISRIERLHCSPPAALVHNPFWLCS